MVVAWIQSVQGRSVRALQEPAGDRGTRAEEGAAWREQERAWEGALAEGRTRGRRRISERRDSGLIKLCVRRYSGGGWRSCPTSAPCHECLCACDLCRAAATAAAECLRSCQSGSNGRFPSHPLGLEPTTFAFGMVNGEPISSGSFPAAAGAWTTGLAPIPAVRSGRRGKDGAD
jgi:hypothetical protein